MNLAITGHSGFIGKNLLPYLESGNHSIKKIDLRSRGEIFFEQADVVIHLAGQAHDVNEKLNYEDYLKVNLELTEKVYMAFINSEAKAFLFISSIKALTDHSDSILTEEMIPEPKSYYGRSKLAAEGFLTANKKNGTRLIILRPCMIHGKRNKGNLNLLYEMMKKGFPFPLGKYQNKRSLLGIENFCFVVKEIIENHAIVSGIYNVADDADISITKLVSIISDSLDKPLRIWNIPKYLIRSIAMMGDWIPLPLNSKRLKKLTENYQVSNKKIIRSIGRPLPKSLEESLSSTFFSFKIK